MEPTTAIPLHFTLQTIAVASAGFLVAWSLVRRRWIGAAGATLFGTAEALHAGRFFSTDDEPALIALRLLGVGLLSIAAIGVGRRKPLYAAGASLIVAGTVWGAVVGRGIADLDVGPHVLVAAGSVLFAMWTWLAARDSVRLRVLFALVGMLAIVVVAGGGSVSRVAAIDKSNEHLRQLGSAATAVRGEIDEAAAGLARRGALLSPLLADDLSSETTARSGLRSDVEESITVFDREGVVRVFVSSEPGRSASLIGRVIPEAILRPGLQGRPANFFDVTGGRLVVMSVMPVFGAGGRQPSDVVGAVAVVQYRSPSELRAAARAYAPNAEIVLQGRGSASSDRDLLAVPATSRPSGDVRFARAQVGDEARPTATTTIGADGVRLVVVGSDAGTVDAATGLLRALLIAILAAAALATVSALWLSARVTRPVLDLAAGAEQVKTDFLSSLSHELRTPLTPIRGYTELLRRGRVPARRAADYLDEIGEAANRLERIVTLLLDVAAQEAGRFRVSASDLRPAEVLGEAAARWEHRSRLHPITVVAPQSLPKVHADPDAIARVLDELIDNAFKFSPDGGAVELRARKAKDGVEFSIEDSGIGISDEQQSELTGAFAQLESGDRRRYGGLGLGLAYVAGVLVAHDGRSSVHSAVGSGTTFAFTLPTASMVSRMLAGTARGADASSASR